MASAVDPGSPRYLRQRTLVGFGLPAQQRLADARVVVIGVGGLGSAVIPALAASGVGTLVLVDDDRVEESNLHRQTLHGPADVGRAKVESAAESIALMSPETELILHETRFAVENAAALLDGADLLIDGSDNFATRFAANDAAAAAGIPLVWGSAARLSGQLGVAWDARGVDFRDLFPDEPGVDDETSCEIVGVLSTVCAVIGAMMATEAIKVLTGVGRPLVGRAVFYEALSGTVREVEYAREGEKTGPGPRPLAAPTGPTGSTGPTVDPVALAGELADRSAAPMLLDVREADELERASLPGATHIPLGELPARAGELDPEADVVVLCHHGIRSQRAAALLIDLGFTRVRNLAGGIDAWATAVDPSVPRY